MVAIRNIDNPFKLEDAQVKEFTFSRDKSLRVFLDESGLIIKISVSSFPANE